VITVRVRPLGAGPPVRLRGSAAHGRTARDRPSSATYGEWPNSPRRERDGAGDLEVAGTVVSGV